MEDNSKEKKNTTRCKHAFFEPRAKLRGSG